MTEVTKILSGRGLMLFFPPTFVLKGKDMVCIVFQSYQL